MKQIPLSRMDERLWAAAAVGRSLRETGLELLDLLQLDCGVLGRSAAHRDDSTTARRPTDRPRKFDYEMVHSEVYLNKYVVSIAPFSTSAGPDCSQNII